MPSSGSVKFEFVKRKAGDLNMFRNPFKVILVISILILLSAAAKAYDEKVSCKISINAEYGKTCRLENVNQDTMSRLEVEIDTKSLKYVYFQFSEIEGFTEEFMEQLKGVEFFNANEVGLKRVDVAKMRKLSKMLIFWGGLNNIKRLEANAFSGNKNLEEIYLKFNQIHQIHETAFDGLHQLYVLDLSSNELKDLTSFLDPIINLGELDLSSNLIEELPVNFFRNLQNLKSLSLTNNNLLFLDPRTFDSLINLENINLSFNRAPFRIINGTLFKNNILLKHILFIGDKINAIDRNFLRNSKPLLQLLSLKNNSCVDNSFVSFTDGKLSRSQELEKCFENFDKLFR